MFLEESMSGRFILSWILILHVLHLPVPAPDLDGECRGAPILSLSEMHAWHILMLGVRPNDDIDQGPIRNDDSGNSEAPADSPFGDPAINATACVAGQSGAFFAPVFSTLPQNVLGDATGLGTANPRRQVGSVAYLSAHTSVRARLCVWCI